MFDRRGSRKYLNDAERSAFLAAVQKERDAVRRSFGLTLFYTGCRISEALNMTTDQIDRPAKALMFETLKRREPGHFRAVPIPDSLMNLIENLPRTEEAGRIWNFSRPTGYRFVKEYMARAGIVGGMASPKGLRHSMAVACLAQKIPLPTVQKWLGHARLETTAIYLDVCGEEERELAKRVWAASKKRRKSACGHPKKR